MSRIFIAEVARERGVREIKKNAERELFYSSLLTPHSSSAKKALLSQDYYAITV